LLGLAIALKLFPALLLGVFVARRSWRTVGSAVVVTAASLVAPALVDPHLLTGYFGVALRAPGQSFASFGNYSALSAAAHLVTPARDFAGTVPALFSASWAVAPLCAVVGILVLQGTARIITRCREDGELAFATGLCAVTILSPLVWQHYLCMLLWPLWRLGRRLERAGWPREKSRAF